MSDTDNTGPATEAGATPNPTSRMAMVVIWVKAKIQVLYGGK